MLVSANRLSQLITRACVRCGDHGQNRQVSFVAGHPIETRTKGRSIWAAFAHGENYKNSIIGSAKYFPLFTSARPQCVDSSSLNWVFFRRSRGINKLTTHLTVHCPRVNVIDRLVLIGFECGLG